MADDEFTFYKDARDGLLTSAADKRRKALNHFDYFLQGYCAQNGIIKTMKGADIPYHGIPGNSTEKSIAEFWDDLIGRFVRYMGEHARAACNPAGPRLGRSTAVGYCSAVKTYFIDKFRMEAPIPVFSSPGVFKGLTDKLEGMLRESNRATGKAMQTEDVSSTRRDREAIATACIWMGTPEFAEFWHLCNASYHCVGRGSETSLIKADGVISMEKCEMVYRYDILAVELQRQKLGGQFQTLPIYPHRDSILEDFYSSLIHLIVVKGCNHDYMLPQLSQAALKKTKSGGSCSDVSRQWTTFHEGIRNTFEVLADEINEKLGSHSNRRGGNQKMIETPSLSGWAAIYRSGLQPKNLATIFDYLFGSAELLSHAGKSLSGWTVKNGDIVMGGQPVTFDDIQTDHESLVKFTDVIFEDDVEGRWKPKVKELLVMTLLLRYDQFVDVLQAHPFTKLVEERHPDTKEMIMERASDDDRSPNPYTCSSVLNSLFINRINQYLEIAGVSNDTFSSWVQEAGKAFVARNGPGGLPLQIWRRYGIEPEGGILMDTRTLIDHFNLQASIIQAIHMEQQRQRHILNDLQQAFNVESRITSSFIVERLFNMEKSLRRLEENLLPEAQPQAPPSSQNVLMFSVSSKSLSTGASLSEVTAAFFADDYPTGWSLQLKSPSYNELDGPGKKKMKNRFSLIKRAVRLVLGHADSFPVNRGNRSQYKQDAFAIARVAEERIRTALQLDKSTITINKMEKIPGLSEYEKTLNLPENTPDDMRIFFYKKMIN
jgi:hypothetical protein